MDGFSEPSHSGPEFQINFKSYTRGFSFDELKIVSGKKKSFVFPSDSKNNVLEIVNKATLTPKEILNNVEELKKLSAQLVENGRFEQALRCMQHAETVAEIGVVKERKRIATERTDYETAVQYRNLGLQLEVKLSPVEEVEKWLGDEKSLKFADLYKQVYDDLGLEVSLEFRDKFVFPEIRNSGDVEKAQTTMLAALHYMEVKRVLKNQISVFYTQTHCLLQKINEEFLKALTIFHKIRRHVTDLMADQSFLVYMRGLPEVFFLYLRISRVIQYCNCPQSFLKVIEEILQNWAEVQEFFPLLTTELVFKPGERMCAICLFADSGLVMLCGNMFHSRCINFWINRVSTEVAGKIIKVNNDRV